jgi:hypothetical protein
MLLGVTDLLLVKIERNSEAVWEIANLLYRDATQKKMPNGDIDWAKPQGHRTMAALHNFKTLSVNVNILKAENKTLREENKTIMRTLKDQQVSCRRENYTYKGIINLNISQDAITRNARDLVPLRLRFMAKFMQKYDHGKPSGATTSVILTTSIRLPTKGTSDLAMRHITAVA